MSFKRGQLLYRQGEPATVVYNIIHGVVSVYRIHFANSSVIRIPLHFLAMLPTNPRDIICVDTGSYHGKFARGPA